MRWLEYPFFVLGILFLAFVWTGQLRSEEAESEARTKASLALSRSAKQRAKTPPVATTREQSDQSKLEEAWREARRRGVPIVCWVAIRAEEYPEFRKSLGDVVHCELNSNEGSSKPRVLFVRSDKMECVAFCTEKGIRDDTAKKMWEEYRERLGLPASRSIAPLSVGHARPVEVPFFVGG
ncbi:MAG: hypothetical protein N2112_12895 [Gemmataceae bacterium]|nr:hypothetical protein [Gemmataceae bacterium]